MAAGVCSQDDGSGVRVDWADYEKVKLKLRACLLRPTYLYRPTQQRSYMLAGDDTTPRL